MDLRSDATPNRQISWGPLARDQGCLPILRCASGEEAALWEAYSPGRLECKRFRNVFRNMLRCGILDRGGVHHAIVSQRLRDLIRIRRPLAEAVPADRAGQGAATRHRSDYHPGDGDLPLPREAWPFSPEYHDGH